MNVSVLRVGDGDGDAVELIDQTRWLVVNWQLQQGLTW